MTACSKLGGNEDDLTNFPVIQESLGTSNVLFASANETLWVKIISPEDGAVVDDPEIAITGEAAPGTVLTINDNILYIENDEEYTVRVMLLQGANLIEIIGSNQAGDEVTLYMTVYYEP